MPSRLELVAGVSVSLALGASAALYACGGRSELDLFGESGTNPTGGGGGAADAGRDAAEDAAEDAPDALPPECASPDTTYIYVVSSQTELLAYKPASNSFESRGMLRCSDGATPFSMAVDRHGRAFVVYTDGELYEVNTENADCNPTDFQPNQFGFFLFGMGFERDFEGDSETLYVAEISFDSPSRGLAFVDLETFELEPIGMFSQNPGNAIELTPTGDGPLHGYFLNNDGSGGTLVEIDTDTADIVDATPLPAGSASTNLAVGWWGGSFFIFTGDAAGTVVTRYDPETGQASVVNTISLEIVGAGVSTCAPDLDF